MKLIVIQGVGFLAAAILLLSYQCKSSKNLFFMQLLANATYMLHYLLLGAYSACVSLSISLFRNLVLVCKGRWAQWKGWPWTLVIANVAVTVLTWESIFSILPCLGVVSLTLSGFTRNGKKVRIANLLVSSPSWLIYNLYTGSWSGFLCELLSIGSVIISVLRYGWKALDTVDSPNS